MIQIFEAKRCFPVYFSSYFPSISTLDSGNIANTRLYEIIDSVLILEVSSSRQNHDSANIIYLFAHFAPNLWPEVPRCLNIAESSLMLFDVWLRGYPNR